MKRIAAILTSLVLVFSLAACGSQQAGTAAGSEATSTASSETASAAQTKTEEQLLAEENDILAANNWNVCQYSLLLMMIAQACDMEAGELVHVIADCHIYDRHIPVIKELISRKPYPAPTVKLNPEIKDFYKFTTDDLIVENYETWPQIKNIPIAV